MEYFNFSNMSFAVDVNLSNNSLYRVDFDIHGALRSLNLNNNRLGRPAYSGETNIDDGYHTYSNISTGGEWLNDESFPSQQNDFPLEKIKHTIETLTATDNDIKSITKNIPTGTPIPQIKTLDLSRNPRLGNIDPSLGGSSQNQVNLTAPNMMYLSLGGNESFPDESFASAVDDSTPALELDIMWSLEELHVNNSAIRKIAIKSGQSPDHFFSKLSTVSCENNNNLEYLNLKYGEDFSQYGYSAYNLENINVSGSSSLRGLWLPIPSEWYSSYSKKYLKSINISGTMMGSYVYPDPDGNLQNGTLQTFLEEPFLTDPWSYPDGHTLSVYIENVTDSSGTIVSPPTTYIQNIMNTWYASGRTLHIFY